jgi:hypothetical protein
MKPKTPMTFKLLHDAPLLIQTDQMALATQMALCRSDRTGRRYLSFLAERTLEFTAQHLISILVLAGVSAFPAFWLIG